MTLKVTVLDVETGDTSEATISEGDYLLTCVAPCYLAGMQAYPLKGTHILTVKGFAPRKSAVEPVEVPGG
jgi:hypothetical protein